MELLEAIRTRRSIRQYTEQAIDEKQIEMLLRAAMAAPSAANAQTWDFVVIDDRRLLAAVAEYDGGGAMLREAPLAVLVCGNPTREEFEGFWVQDCSAATQNLLLAAHDLGLGAVWIALYPIMPWVEKTRELFGLPEEIVPMAFVAVGHPAEALEPEDRYDAAKVHRNKWR